MRIRQAPLSEDGLRVLNLKDVPRKDWERKGIYVPRPVYAIKAYNTSFYQVKDSEKELFSIRQGKDDPPLRETAQLLLNAEGINKEMVCFLYLYISLTFIIGGSRVGCLS